ncbi:helix-turn-helix domain-containing protein [Streptomyces sp. NPDC053541]|uniref:helix-turn-helix domain-containing protein n=1 Tax=Streptomyces sp. NPDC053541 TaxID=3365709 RepID=UPI0037D95E0A
MDRQTDAGRREAHLLSPAEPVRQHADAAEPLESLKRLLRRLRVEQGLTMGGLARRAGLGRTTTSQALNGGTVPSEATLVSLARALRTPADPLLGLRALACTAADAEASGVSGGPQSRFTYAYLDQRPTNLLRVLHGKVREFPLVGLRIRTVLVHRAVRADDPGLPALMVQCAEECHAFKDRIKSPREAVEAMFVLVYLAVVFDDRSPSDPAMEDVYAEVYTAAMVFLAEFDIDSLNFLHLQGFLDGQTSGGVIAPWPLLDAFYGQVAPCFPEGF